jgi:hypothetical protein
VTHCSVASYWLLHNSIRITGFAPRSKPTTLPNISQLYNQEKTARANRAMLDIGTWSWLGNMFRIPQNFAIKLILDLLNSGIFIGFFFPIVKCVPANSEHISSDLESSPAINSSNFMKQKTVLPSVCFGLPKKISSFISQPVDPTMLIHVNVGTLSSKAILLTII